MLVINKVSRKVVEAVKQEDGMYLVEDKKFTKEELQSLYGKAPEPKKEEESTVSKQSSEPMLVISGECDMGGDIGKLAEALALCQGEFTSVKKGTKAFNYNYADISAVLESSSPITSKHGIAISQMNISKVVSGYLLVGVKTILMHSGGGYISSEVFVPTDKTKSNTIVQMAGVSITYLRRYGIQSALGLATTDSDGKEV